MPTPARPPIAARPQISLAPKLSSAPELSSAQRIALGLSAAPQMRARSLSDIPMDPGMGGLCIGVSALRPGDVIVSTTSGGSSIAIRLGAASPVSHAAIVLKNGEIAESLSGGVEIKTVAAAVDDDLLAVALRPNPELTSDQIDRLDAWVRSQRGRSYDYQGVATQAAWRLSRFACAGFGIFGYEACRDALRDLVVASDQADRWFCSELVFAAFGQVGHTLGDQAGTSRAPSDLAEQMGRKLAYVGHLKTPTYSFMGQPVSLSRSASVSSVDVEALIREAVAEGMPEAEARAFYAEAGLGAAGGRAHAKGLQSRQPSPAPTPQLAPVPNVQLPLPTLLTPPGSRTAPLLRRLTLRLFDIPDFPLDTFGDWSRTHGFYVISGPGQAPGLSTDPACLFCPDGRRGLFGRFTGTPGWSMTGGLYVGIVDGRVGLLDGLHIGVAAGAGVGPGHRTLLDAAGQPIGASVTLEVGGTFDLTTILDGLRSHRGGGTARGQSLGLRAGSFSQALARAPRANGAQALTAGGRDLEVRLRGFIPSPAVALAYEGMPGEQVFVGDGRSFDYAAGTHRFQVTGKVAVPGPGGGTPRVYDVHPDWGRTEEYAGADASHPSSRPFWWRDLRAGVRPTRTSTDHSSSELLMRLKESGFFSRPAAGHTVVQVRVVGANPLVSMAPAIDADLELDFWWDGGTLRARVTGDHDGFPAYELYIDRRLVYSHDPVASNQTPVSLFPPAEFDVDASVSLSAGAHGPSAPSRGQDARSRGHDAPSRGHDAPSRGMTNGQPGSREGRQGPVGWRVAELEGPHPGANGHAGAFQPQSFEALGRIEAPGGGEVSARFPVSFESNGGQIRNLRVADPQTLSTAAGWRLQVDGEVEPVSDGVTLRFRYRFTDESGGGDALTLAYRMNGSGEVKRSSSWASTGDPGQPQPQHQPQPQAQAQRSGPAPDRQEAHA